MVKRQAVFEAIRQTCRNVEYEVTESKSTDSIYLTIIWGVARICLRFSDHKGKTDLKWFDYANPRATYEHMVQYIRNGIEFARRAHMYRCWHRIAS